MDEEHIVSAAADLGEDEMLGVDNVEMSRSVLEAQEERFLAPDDLSDIEEETQGRRFPCAHCERRLCSWILYFWVGIFVAGCFTAVVVVSVLVVGPYRAAAKFRSTQCMPYALHYNGVEEQCSCGKGCTSAFPCIKVLITYEETASPSPASPASSAEPVRHNVSENILLHETETVLYRERKDCVH